MAALTHTQSRRMYSWWWDSHISPKNSKWLQDNLTDMDSKLKSMIKLIEEDADSFARRAEMYYKKRPELMKLIEDFYRAYRALAERYDHATVVIRQAHRTMTEAFPNQVPPILGEDSPANSPYEDEPRTPESSTHKNVLFQTDDFQKVGLELPSSHVSNAKSNGENTGGSDFVAKRKFFKQNNLSGPGDYHKLADVRVRKGLNFQDMNKKEQSVESREDRSFQAQAESGQVHEPEEILILRKALADVEAEKEAGLIQYQQSLDKLSKLESEISRAQEDSRELSERASTAEAEVQNLKEAITKLEAEKDANLLQYHQCLDKISSLDDIISQAEMKARELDERACKAETQAQSLQDEIAKLTSEKDVALDQYVLSLEKISNLENRLELAEEDARKLSERAEKAEREIETLRQEISKLSEEKEIAALQYQQSLNTISSLETKLSNAQEEAKLLKNEVDNGVEKLKGAEEQCAMLERSNQTLHAELESLMLKMGAQGQELTEKQKEVGRLWSSVQEERLRFVEAETAFQTLQHLHGQVQEELRTVASELQSRVQILKDVEAHNRELQDEVTKIKEENMGLNELNVSSSMSIKNMQEENNILREAKGKLEEEVELRVDQRNALQQEIYCLKEELNDLNKKHTSVLEQVHAVGFNPECLKSSVTELQDQISNLKETCERERIEKKALLEKLEILAQLLEKNSLLENSLSDLSAELEAARGKINALEESCQSLLKEKSVLLDEKASLGSKLQEANENLEKLSEKNTVLENSLCDAHDELQTLKLKSKSLEDSYQLLAGQKDGLVSEKDNLSTQLDTTRLQLEELEKGLAELQERCLLLEKDKESALGKIEELQISLNEKKQEHAHFVQINETRFAAMQSKVHMLQEECQSRKREFDVELDSALHSEIQIFILQRCGKDLKLANKTLLIKYEKLLEASTLSETLISQLQKENTEQHNEVKSLSHQTSVLRKGFFPLLEALDLAFVGACQDTIEQDLLNLTSVLHKIEEIKQSFYKTEEEKQQLGLEKMVLITLLQQLRLEAEGLSSEKSNIEQELKTRNKHITMLQGEVMKFHDMNEEMKLKLTEGNQREEALLTEVTSLQRNLLDIQVSLKDLQTENLKIHEEKRALTEETLLLNDRNCTLEEENYVMCGEMLSAAYLSVIFKTDIDDKTVKMRELGEHLDKLQLANGTIQEKLNSTERILEEVQTENHGLRQTLQKSEDELKIVNESRDKLSIEIGMAKNLLLVEHEKAKIHEENLQSELQKQSNEIEILEAHADVLFNQLQTSTVYQVLYEEKIHELTEAFDSLNYASTVKDTDMELLKEKVSMLSAENEGLHVQLAAYGPAVTSLKEGISSLENKTSLLGKIQKADTEEFKGVEGANDEDSQVDGEKVIVPDAFSELQNLPNRILAIEKTVVEMEQLVMQGKADGHARLEAALMQIEELKSDRSLRRENFKTTSKICEVENGLLTKDIVLDQISESRRQQVEPDNQIFELQDAADQDNSNGRTVDKAKEIITPTTEEHTNFLRNQSVRKKRGMRPASDAVEKELSVDKLEISKNSVDYTQEGNNGKVLQRLNSDVQKLMNLHITVQDLKGKLEMTEKSRRGKAVDEHDTLKGQLEEAQATILKLFGLNGKLLKNIEDGSSTSDMKSIVLSKDFGSVRKEISGSRKTSEDFGSARREISGQARKTSEDFGSARREISGQARRISERIGRLQLEVQKIQFALLKLLNEKETKRRVLLRDYLYGGLRTNHGSRKKAPFCACIQPKTYGD